MFKILRYTILLILASFSLSYASTEFYEQRYSPRPKRPLNFANLTEVQIASIILDGKSGKGTDIPNYGIYRLFSSSFNKDTLKDFLLASSTKDVFIRQMSQKKESDRKAITLEIYDWDDTEKELNINYFILKICEVPQHRSKKKNKKTISRQQALNLCTEALIQVIFTIKKSFLNFPLMKELYAY